MVWVYSNNSVMIVFLSSWNVGLKVYRHCYTTVSRKGEPFSNKVPTFFIWVNIESVKGEWEKKKNRNKKKYETNVPLTFRSTFNGYYRSEVYKVRIKKKKSEVRRSECYLLQQKPIPTPAFFYCYYFIPISTYRSWKVETENYFPIPNDQIFYPSMPA